MGTDFGWGHRVIDGNEEHGHIWPVTLFVKHFRGMPDTPENWKAAVYKWGGPPPSKISEVKVIPLPADGEIMIAWKEVPSGV